MSFDFNLYSTPLLFGWVQGWIYAMLFVMRAWRTERLSDWLFAALLAAFTFEIWEYMLGFAEIEILWRELDFFPRGFSLLLPPLIWFYLKSLVNDTFKFKRGDWVHAIPFLLNSCYHLIVFFQGPSFVKKWQETVHNPYQISVVVMVFSFVQWLWYLFKSYELYRQYLDWTPTQFSDTQQVSFRWFRNFLIAMGASVVVGMVMTILSAGLQLDFWNDWWDELFQAALIYYLGITAYSQSLPGPIRFESQDEQESIRLELRTERLDETTLHQWKLRLEQLIEKEKPWLDSELTLTELARRLQTNPSVLSSVINSAFGKNFNDYINAFRVSAVQELIREGKTDHLSLLGIGMECGFNSKSTFNRAFKKSTGVAPSEWKPALLAKSK